MKNIIKLLLGGLLVLSIPAIVEASTTVTKVDRYLQVTNQPTFAQANLFAQTFQVHFPPAIKTIGNAIQYLLRFSGYSLSQSQPRAAMILLAQPLPEVDRNFGPMTLQAGIQILVGKPFGLLIDPIHRLIALRLLPAYQPLYETFDTVYFGGSLSRN